MTRTAVKSVTPFEFRSDFKAPTAQTTQKADTVSLSANELAELLANARNEGMVAADARHDKDTGDKLSAMSAQLKAALEQLLKLAQCLDESALPPETETGVKQLLTTACAHIVNGQSDLFADQ